MPSAAIECFGDRAKARTLGEDEIFLDREIGKDPAPLRHEDAWTYRTADAARTRRRGDRIKNGKDSSHLLRTELALS
jgi:hypothetical protein